MDVQISVSIPIGFSNELQRSGSGSAGSVRCLVSIPIGFSNELQPSLVELLKALRSVSIPIGFSNELQHNHARKEHGL